MLQALCLLPSDELACAVGVDQAPGSTAAPLVLGVDGLAHFEQLVLQAFHNEWVGESKAAELLNMSLPNFYRWRCQLASPVT